MTSTSYKRKVQENGIQKRAVTFEDQELEWEEVERSWEQDFLSEEKDSKESRRDHEQNPDQESLSRESGVDENVLVEGQDLENKFFFPENLDDG